MESFRDHWRSIPNPKSSAWYPTQFFIGEMDWSSFGAGRQTVEMGCGLSQGCVAQQEEGQWVFIGFRVPREMLTADLTRHLQALAERGDASISFGLTSCYLEQVADPLARRAAFRQAKLRHIEVAVRLPVVELGFLIKPNPGRSVWGMTNPSAPKNLCVDDLLPGFWAKVAELLCTMGLGLGHVWSPNQEATVYAR